VANYGTSNNTPFTRPDSVPDRSDTVLVTSLTYDNAGNQNKSIDPAGIVTVQLFDARQRVVSTIRNYTGGNPGNTTDVTVSMSYNPTWSAARAIARRAFAAVGVTWPFSS
jgi:hypothetical protein